MLDFGILMLASLLMECSCIAPLTLVVIVMRGLVFQPLFCVVLISGSYLVCSCMRACSGNLLWQYVNSMNWIVYVDEGSICVCVWCGASSIQRICGLNLAWHWQVVCGHVHLRSRFVTICSGVVLLRLHALVSVKNRVCLLACNVMFG